MNLVRSRRDGSRELLGAFPLLFLIAIGSGCRLLDRERYSLVIRKPAHRYRELTPAEWARVQAERASERPITTGTHDELPPPEVEEGEVDSSLGYVLEPFRPFAYCHTHQSAHVAESLAAALLAPAELSIALTADTGIDFALALARELESWWRLFFPTRPTEKEPIERTRPK